MIILFTRCLLLTGYIMHEALAALLLWHIFNDMFCIWRWYFIWIYGMLNRWNEMKRNQMFSRAPLRDTSELTPLKDTKNRLLIQVNRLKHATSYSLQPARTELKNKNQLDATYFILLLIGSTYFGHYYALHLELATIMLITTLVVSFLACCVLEVRCG